MIWFSSDWHFQHTNIAGPKVSKWDRGYRTFNNTWEMDQTIINNLNDCVQHNDTLYFLGDFAFGDKRKIPELRARINCSNIYFAKGNHDQAFDKEKTYQKLFTEFGTYFELYVGSTLICMNHYAPRIWNESHHGSIALWGHSHGTLPETKYRSMDVGIDCFYADIPQAQYSPFNLDSIMDRMLKRPAMEIDHHRKK